MLLTWDSSPSSMPTIQRFALFPAFYSVCMFNSRFKHFHTLRLSDPVAPLYHVLLLYIYLIHSTCPVPRPHGL